MNKEIQTVTARIGLDFAEEMEEIKKERINRGIDKKRKSTKRLTNLLTKHKAWEKIKEDTIEVNLDEE